MDTMLKTAEADSVPSFHWADYLVLSICLAASGAIGIYYGVQQRKGGSVDQFLVAGRSMSVIPVGISLFVTWMSAISVVADPVEVYYQGGIYWFMGLGYMLAIPVIATWIAPFHHKLQYMSSLQSLRVRFGSVFPALLIVVTYLSSAFYQGIVLFAPSTAFSIMTGLDVKWCMVIIGGLCCFYTSVGGLKAVLWADTVQTVVLLAGIIACLVEATRSVGGMGKVWQIADEGGRINFVNFDPNPLARATFWTYFIGGFFRVFIALLGGQEYLQRYVAVKTKTQVRQMLYISLPLFAVFVSLLALTGIVMYAYFHECDPLVSGKVKAPDQMVPLMVMETLSSYPGVPGLFLAALVGAAMSTLSSAQSGLTAIFLKDVIQPAHERRTGKAMSDRVSTVVAVALSVLFGLINIGLGFLIEQLQATSIFTIVSKVPAGIASAIGTVFFVRVFVPWMDSFSCMFGFLIGLAGSLWFGIGSFVDPSTPLPNDRLPIPVDGCFTTNFTDTSTGGDVYTADWVTATITPTHQFQINDLYRMSPPLFSAFGFVVGVVFSLIIGGLVKCAKCLRARRTSATSYALNIDSMKGRKVNEISSDGHVYN